MLFECVLFVLEIVLCQQNAYLRP